ncbi:MAG: hypothetical protein ACC742_07025 [Thermoanaerobaculales bacterium]
MKRILTPFALVLTLALVTPSALAQTADDAIELTRQVIQTERQAIVATNLGLDEAEGAIFWPLYREYRTAIQKVLDRKVGMLKSFAENFETLTDEQALQLLDDHLGYRRDLIKVQTTYAKKMRKVLPGTTVARFFQIENKMDAIIRYELASEVPLMR